MWNSHSTRDALWSSERCNASQNARPGLAAACKEDGAIGRVEDDVERPPPSGLNQTLGAACAKLHHLARRLVAGGRAHASKVMGGNARSA